MLSPKKVIITKCQTPFTWGGAEHLAIGLRKAIEQAGHYADIVTAPFNWKPVAAQSQAIDYWLASNWSPAPVEYADVTICLQFPTYYLNHSNKRLWLCHQHRIVYDLWESLGSKDEDYADGKLRERIHALDTEHLAPVKKLYTISENVANRLKRFNGINALPLYHPPPIADLLYTLPAEPFIFLPSRAEWLKRQTLLIEAMKLVKSPVVALMCGGGGLSGYLADLIRRENLGDKVRWLGAVSAEQMAALYAKCLGVFFGPVDEDLGYVTLEAMLASKPVITCQDSGGPLEFVVDNETGNIVPPYAEHVAAAIDALYQNQSRAADMGRAGLARYHELGIDWKHVVDVLVN